MAEMGPTTPAREIEMIDSEYTRQRDPLSPLPFQTRLGEKTRHTSLPSIVPGGPQRMTALQRVNGLLQEAEQQAATRRKFTNALVSSLEGIVKTFTQKEMYTVLPDPGRDLNMRCRRAHNGHSKGKPKYFKSKRECSKGTTKFDVGGSRENPKAGGPLTAPQSGTSKANSAKKSAAKAAKVDKRILARCAPFAGPRRDSPFLIRESLVKAIPGINEGDIPEVVGCKTGWALHPKSLEVRDILMKETHRQKILRDYRGYSLGSSRDMVQPPRKAGAKILIQCS
ncbi:hypothetical protein DID88_007481 [Monilinia fructigena]|uniref:Uncharacterized protein n=1 Tax=Monilinia fructigena TaxID=38457 RepID=A0A395J8K2_9HELO|nr:hypothetical protein DID88_007481 [Monilinia fructigena]